MAINENNFIYFFYYDELLSNYNLCMYYNIYNILFYIIFYLEYYFTTQIINKQLHMFVLKKKLLKCKDKQVYLSKTDLKKVKD